MMKSTQISAAVGWKSPNNSISSNSSSSTSDESSTFSTLPTRSVKAPNSKPINQINQQLFHTIANYQTPSKSQQSQSIESTQQTFQNDNAGNISCKKRNGLDSIREYTVRNQVELSTLSEQSSTKGCRL